jgi:O-antigen/teichoic acid export membrane protein
MELQPLLRRLLRDSIPPGFYTNAAWQYATSFASAGFQFVYLVALAALLGTREFGRFSLALAFVTMAFQLVELRLHEAVIRFAAEFRARDDFARLVAFTKLSLLADAASGALAFAAACALAPLAARLLLKDPAAVSLILLAAFAVFFQNVSTATAVGLYRTFNAVRVQAIVTACGGLLKLAATIVFVKVFDAGAAEVMAVAIAAHFLTNAVLTTLALRILRRHVPPGTRGTMAMLGDRWRDLARFTGSTYALSLSMIPTKELDVNLLGYFSTPAVVGTYKIAKTFFTAVSMIVDPALFVIYPQLAAMWVRRELVKIGAFIRSIVAVFGSVALLVCIVATFAVPPLIVLLNGPEYRESGSIFRWLIWGLAIWAPTIWVNPLLMAADRPDLVTKASILGSVLVVILYLIFIPRLGARGAALAQALAPPIVMSIALFFGRRAGIIRFR